jgi:hypothetical protein
MSFCFTEWKQTYNFVAPKSYVTISPAWPIFTNMASLVADYGSGSDSELDSDDDRHRSDNAVTKSWVRGCLAWASWHFQNLQTQKWLPFWAALWKVKLQVYPIRMCMHCNACANAHSDNAMYIHHVRVAIASVTVCTLLSMLSSCEFCSILTDSGVAIHPQIECVADLVF